MPTKLSNFRQKRLLKLLIYVLTFPCPAGNLATVSFDISKSRDQTQRLTATPYALLLDENAPILQLSGRTWPFPQHVRGIEPAISIWMPQKSIPVPNARSPRPCLLKSAQTISWIANSVDYLAFKHEVIGWVNSRLGSLECATNDTTIGVIICLMSWEVSHESIPCLGIGSKYGNGSERTSTGTKLNCSRSVVQISKN